MKTFLSVLIIFIVLVVAGAMLRYMDRETSAPEEFEINLSPEVDAIQMCYKWADEGGSRSMLSMDLREDKVIGEFYWLPFEKDSKTGVFRGTVTPLIQEIMGRRIEAIWEASGEGVTNAEPIKMEFGDGSAVVEGFPQMWQTDCGDANMD